jgi:hypothetical protein
LLLESDAEISVSEAESIIRCRTSARDEKLSEVLRQLVNSGDRVAQFREVAGDLEEACVSAARVAEAELADQGQSSTSSVNPTAVKGAR